MQSGSIAAEIERLNWSLAAVTDVMRVLVRARTEHEVFLAACEAATRQNFYDVAWIGLPRHDEQRSVVVGARSGELACHLDGLDIRWADVPEGRGPTGTALRTGQLQICNDHASNHSPKPWHDWMRRLGLKSGLSLPIRLPSGSVIASMTVYSRYQNAFGEAEAALFRQLGDDIGLGIDILRTRAAYGEARAMAEQQERRIQMLTAALRTGVEGLAIADREGRIFSVNPAFTRITGHETADILGQHPSTLVAGLPDERSFPEIWRTAEESGSWQGEIRCRRKGGGSFPALLGLNAVRSTDGPISHYVTTLLDLSPLKAAEEAARDERIFSESMMQSMPGIIYFYDSDYQLQRWNSNFTRVTGYSDEELAGMRPFQFFHAEDWATLQNRIDDVFDSGESWLKAPLMVRDGTRIPYLFTGRRVEIQGREYLVGIGIDVSECKGLPTLPLPRS